VLLDPRLKTAPQHLSLDHEVEWDWLGAMLRRVLEDLVDQLGELLESWVKRLMGS
jgi:CDP-diglyceride synthetase